MYGGVKFMTASETQEKTSVETEVKETIERKIKMLEVFGVIKPINPKRIAPGLNYVAQAFEKK